LVEQETTARVVAHDHESCEIGAKEEAKMQVFKWFVRKGIVVAVLLLLSGWLFAGEGNKTDGSQSGPFAGTEIAVLTLNQSYATGIEDIVSEFEAETGIRVELEILAQQPLLQKVGIELVSGSSAYDLLWIEADDLSRYATGGYISGIDGYIADSELVDANLNIDDFLKSNLDSFRYDGVLYSLPYFAACQMLYYRFDILEAHGYDSAPATFDDLLEIARSVHNDPVPAIALRGQAGAHNIWVWSQFLYGYGGRYFRDYPNDLSPVINSPEAIEALDMYVELMQNYSIPDAVSATFDEVVVAMQQGDVAMAIEGGPLGGRILDPEQSEVIGKVGFAVSPGGPAGVFPPFTSSGWVINDASRNKEAAFLFLQWATSTDIMKRVSLDQLHVAVTRNSVWEDADFRAKYDFDWGRGSYLQAYQDTLKVAPSWYRPGFGHWAEVRDIVGNAVQEAVIGRRTSAEALREANEDMERLLRENGYIE